MAPPRCPPRTATRFTRVTKQRASFSVPRAARSALERSAIVENAVPLRSLSAALATPALL